MCTQTIQLITIQGKDLFIKGITKGSNAIVDSKYGTFLISKQNFNKLVGNPYSECSGVITQVEGYTLPMFKSLKF